MTGVEKCSTAKSGFLCRAKRLVRAGAGILGLTLVTVITATVVVPSGPVTADQVSGLQEHAAQISKDLVLEQLQIGTYEQRYGLDVAKVQADEARIGSIQEQIQSEIGRVSRDHKRLLDEALWAYINSGTTESTGALALFSGSNNEADLTAEYEQVASGDASTTISALRSDENRLRAERAKLVRQETLDRATTDEEATLATSARRIEGELQSKKSEITGQLALAVAHQQAEQAAAATAEVRAAQGSAAVASTGMPSLPPFLQCVLRVESGGNYRAVSPDGAYMGGFQFSLPTWNEAAKLAGMPQLVNVHPNDATPAEQDDVAIALYEADGEQPWNDSCRNS
jgi:hypothetical protein